MRWLRGLLGFIAALVILGRLVPGGWSFIWSSASAAGKTHAVDFYTGLDRPHTIFAGLLDFMIFGGGVIVLFTDNRKRGK